MEKQRREVEQIYDNIYAMNNAQIDRFINNHEEFFSDFNLNENEKKVLEDRFSKICCTN